MAYFRPHFSILDKLYFCVQQGQRQTRFDKISVFWFQNFEIKLPGEINKTAFLRLMTSKQEITTYLSTSVHFNFKFFCLD